jgi:hypothetical protein
MTKGYTKAATGNCVSPTEERLPVFGEDIHRWPTWACGPGCMCRAFGAESKGNDKSEIQGFFASLRMT